MQGQIASSSLVVLISISCTSVSAQALSRSDLAIVTDSETLVQQAVAADKQGDGELREKLLKKAIEADPENQVARWLDGQIQFERQWQSVDEVEHVVSNDRRWKEYRRRVEASDSSLASQVALARWCRRSGLEREERWHWQKVIDAAPDHSEAMKRLGLEQYEGELRTRAEVAELKEAQKQLKRFLPTLQRLVRQAEDEERRDDVLAEIAAIEAPSMIPALVEAMTIDQRTRQRLMHDLDGGAEKFVVQLHTAGVKALANMESYEATEKLVEVAILSPYVNVWQLAAESLKGRLETDYMPLLMAGMKAPLELSIEREVSPSGGVMLTETLSEAGQKEDRETVRTSDYLTATRHTSGRTGRSWVEYDPARDRARASRHIRRTENWLQYENQLRELRNQRIQEVLFVLTGRDLNSNAEQWWQAWQDYNEFEGSLDKPVRQRRLHEDYSDYTYDYEPVPYKPVAYRPSPRRAESTPIKTYVDSKSNYPNGSSTEGPRYGSADPYPQISRIRDPCSCFAAGTPVWTQEGPRSIEEIEVGDLVLSQDPISGTLDFRPVLQTTVRPPSAVRKITFDGETITSTLGHRFWITGHGWQMTKFLEPGFRLFGANGSLQIEAIESAGETEAFNLMVAEYHTYFVGQRRLLVHDNTIPQHSLTIVPGVQPVAPKPPANLR